MISLLRILYTVILVAVSPISTGYEVSTHQDMSDAALVSSNLASRLSELGLKDADQVLTTEAVVEFNGYSVVGCLELPGGGTEKKSIRQLVRRGAFCEDVTLGTSYPGRYLFHFFDPANGGRGFGGFSSSLVWGLENVRVATQDYSYSDANEYLFQALTLSDQVNREKMFAKAFRTLGHVMHLVQDLGQPQHTRGDGHGGGSLYERFTDLDAPGSRIRANLPMTGYPAPVPELPEFLWHTADRKGLADYSNRGFVSTGTNLTGTVGNILPSPKYTLPDGSGAAIERKQVTDADLLGPNGPGQTLSGEIWFVSTPVRDEYAGTSVANARTTTFSIFDSDLKVYNSNWIFTLNRFNFTEAHKLLIPRAVGYSAALLNYFVRGRIQAALPAEGVYAVVDTAASSCGAQCGFPRIRLRLRNTTLGEDMGPGTLRVVAKYHRNLCFQRDLSGDFGAPQFKGNGCRSIGNYVSVSNPRYVAEVGRDFSIHAHEFTFGEAEHIPIDASDVVLQVIFRGVLGKEVDAVAVTTKDIAEPNHFGVSNVSDYVFDDIGDQRYHSLPYQGITTDVPATSFGVAIGGSETPLATLPLLRGGQFARLAFLTDKYVEDVPMTLFYYGSAHDYLFQPEAFELDEATGQYRRSCPVFPRRGLHWDRMVFFPQLRSTSTHGPIGGKSSSRHLKLAHACELGGGGQHDMTLMTPFAVQDSLPWVINF